MTTRMGLAGTGPVIWSALGYQFEAASMIAGLSACLMVRIWVSLNAGPPSAWAWAVDVTERPAPFYALLSGTGFGARGAGIIAAALGWVKRIGPIAGLPEEGGRP